MLRLEKNERFCWPFYHILKGSKCWVHNTCLTRGEATLFASLSNKFGKTIVFIRFSVGHRSIACTPLFSLSLGIYVFIFSSLSPCIFALFMICTFFFDYPCDWHGLHVLRDHVAINTLCTFSHAFRGFLVNLALLWSAPFPSFFLPVWIIRKDIERSHEIYGLN